jgi:hypothetical protein
MHPSSFLATGLSLAATLAHAAAAPENCSVRSGATVTPVVELFTSEGCNSCPPADRWMSTLKTDPGVVALAFHVDYWDRLGWPDRFARASWSERQQSIANAARSAVVYTPQIVLQGRDAGAGRGADALLDVSRSASMPARATIELSANIAARRVIVDATAHVPAAAERAGSRLVIAYTDGGHRTDVKRGENAGVTLRHEHVVRTLVTSDASRANGALGLTTSLELPSEAGTHPRLVVFVERHAARDVLQTVVLPLDPCTR